MNPDDPTEKIEDPDRTVTLKGPVPDIVQSSAKYEVLGELGRGGMGEVLRVRDRDLKREVAMKRLLPASNVAHSSATQDDLVRFIEEAQATGQLEHPNIVPVHDIGVDSEGRVYFTLKYVQGLSLKKVIRGRLVDEESNQFRTEYSALRMIEILISICQAVAYAHSKRIIHRDLKPDNVMLGKYGEVLVMDWGLAKVLGSKRSDKNEDRTVRISTSRAEDASQATMEGSIAGTPAYMSPEQAEGRISELDERTDIYSLGAILYEVLTGEPPYGGGTALEVIRKVVAGGPRPLKKRKGAFGFSPVPRELAAICERAMARKLQDRYTSVAAIRQDLQAYLENLPVSAAPDNSLQQFGKWIKRNRRQVKSSALTGAVVLLLVFGGWFGWRAWRLHRLIDEGRNRLDSARNEFKYNSPPVALSMNDAYAGQMSRMIWAQKAAPYRNRIQEAMEPLRAAIDLSPNNAQARTLLAEANMELWRLAIFEQNAELAKVTRREVESFSADPALYSAELNGFGSFIAAFDATDADAYLFSFETLNLRSKDGVPQPSRLIPVPYDVKSRQPDAQFLQQEAERIAAGKPVPVDRHSIFNLEPTPASKAGSGSQLVIPQLAPGNYMLLVRAPGRVDVRISFRMDRLARLNQQYVLPKMDDGPPGFFYMAGGDVIVGGETAGAPAPHTMKIPAAWIYHDEISMGEYGAFLKSLFNSGKAGEAMQRLPKDFGKNIATLSSAGELTPVENGIAAEAFAKSPVRGVSFNDAQAYVAWRGSQEGLPYRLPDEWEWEAACRGADGRKYSWGDLPGKGLAVVTQGYGDTGNRMSWRWEDYKDESPWGIHNLAGGVAEWTQSLYDPNAKAEDPVFGQHAIRGNAWALPPVGLECAFRTSGQPDYFHPTIGFRMALNHPYARTGPPQATSTDPQAGHQH
jgi:serine/threonine protein kinase/formylglycine-generating enzyme required for sulfatase activity